ncbi:MAG TPA: PilZ domain-containing protein [Nitrospirae bacterium]|nr:PilZ domain-containing protein [Nitrospirota bacterium]HDZ00641.1 PilZ domain-containing protein [Nitrospirota bacterium]
MSMLNERRRFKRFDVSLDVTFETSMQSGEYMTGVTKNFSRSGLCFESRAFTAALKSTMELKLKLPGQDSFVSVLGDVAWKEELRDKCWIGLQLREINKEAKRQILDYAYDLWVEENRKLIAAGKG